MVIKMKSKTNKENNILIIGVIVLFALCCYFIYQTTNLKKSNIEGNTDQSSQTNMNELNNDNILQEEFEYYNQSINKEYLNQSSTQPYIPTGFSYIEGEWNTGFVIQDENENQYVWVPCTNVENEDIVKLQRYNFTEDPFIDKDLCTNEEYEEFITSALENGGFYISRYEIGKEADNPVSKSGIEVWSKITKETATNIIDSMYKNNNEIKCKLMNGYAYDTTLLWLMKTNELEITRHNIVENTFITTGTKSYNNIFDFVDNVMELTSEENYGTVIIRGFAFSSKLSEIASSYGVTISNYDRLSIYEDDDYFSDGTLLGFRTIIYK